MANFPFPVDPILSAVAISYRNKRLIADLVLPRISVGGVKFKYLKHSLEEGFTVPDTNVGRKSRPNEVSFTATEVTDSTLDHGLEDPIPSVDINNAPPNFRPIDHSVMMISGLIDLEREVRTAGVVFNAGTYPAGKKVALSGAGQWTHADSTPIDNIAAGIDALLFRPNTMVIGRSAFRVLSQHPHILKAVHRNEGDSGIARVNEIAQLFELDQVLVGEGWVNVAKKGQTIDLQRVWGGHCALLYLDPMASSPEGMPTFGFTAQYMTRVAGTRIDPDIGLRGGTRVRVGESVKEVIAASDMGYFLQNAVA